MDYSLKHNDFLLSIEDLLIAGFSLDQVKKAAFRKQIIAATRGQYLFKSLKSWQNQVKERLFNGLEPSEWLKTQQKEAEKESLNELQDSIKNALETGYTEYLNEYMTLGPLRAREYAKAAATIHAISCFMNKNNIGVRKYGWFKDTLMPVLNDFKTTLPTNPLILQRNYFQRMAKEGLNVTEIVKAPRTGNTNAAKNKTDEELMAWITYLRSLSANFSNAHIARIVRLNCELTGKTIPSDSWTIHELAKAEMKFITSATRFNPQSKQSNPYTSTIPLANALFAGDCWQADGTRINMVPHKNNGKEQFLYIIAVRDVHSGDILGMHFDYVENRFGWMSALRNAVENTGYLPYQLVIDRFPGHNTDEFKTVLDKLARYGCKVTITTKATGKAQTERWFGTLQSVFMQNSKYYYGEGIKSSRIFAHRSEEYLRQVKVQAREDLWDIEKAITESVHLVEMYRNTPLSKYSRRHQSIQASPAQLHIDSAKPNAIAMKLWQLADVFWPSKMITLQKNQILMQVDHEEALYVLNESHYSILKQYSGARLLVRYNESDLDKVYIFDLNTECLITDLDRTNRVQIYGPNAELGKLSKMKASARAIDQQRRSEIMAATEKAQKSLAAPLYLDNTYDETALLMGRTAPKAVKEAAENKVLVGRENSDELDIDVRDFY